MRFNDDFMQSLKEFDRMPVNTISEAMQIVKSEKDLKERLDFIEKYDTEQKGMLEQLKKLQNDISISKQQRTEIDNSMKLQKSLMYQLVEQKMQYEQKLRDAQNQQVQLNFSVMAQIRQ